MSLCRRVVCCGHSLGAALATLGAFWWSLIHPEVGKGGGSTRGDVHENMSLLDSMVQYGACSAWRGGGGGEVKQHMAEQARTIQYSTVWFTTVQYSIS
jgi:hypothetical protein